VKNQKKNENENNKRSHELQSKTRLRAELTVC